MGSLIFAILAFVVGASCFAITLYFGKRIKLLRQNGQQEVKEPPGCEIKKIKKRRTILFVLAVFCFWLALSQILTLIFGPSTEQLHVEIFPPNVNVLGLSVSQSVLWSWVMLAVVLVLALIFRLFVAPRFTDTPGPLQNVMELAVDWVSSYSSQTADLHSDALSAYMFSTLVFLLGSAALEMFGVRSPTSDLLVTAALAIMAFLMFNYYGIKVKGPVGRLKSMAEPTPIVFPFEIISMVSKPVSLACRLFGNMLGGMIVIDLLYVALGNHSVGIPGLVGLYFNVFHPLIQAYIFITLSLTFIRESVE